MTLPKEPPEGCQEIPGYIVDLFEGSAWLTKDLQVTTVWSERGVWATQDEANAAMAALFKELAE
jgi:hypothetical protein